MSECRNCGRGNGEHTDNCITGLRQQLSTLREAANYTVNAWASGSMEGTYDGIEALTAALKEQNK